MFILRSPWEFMSERSLRSVTQSVSAIQRENLNGIQIRMEQVGRKTPLPATLREI